MDHRDRAGCMTRAPSIAPKPKLALVERLREVGQRHGRPPGQVAIAWALQNPAVTGAIVGARSAKQVEGNVGAAEEMAEIEGRNTYEPELVTAV